MKVIFFWGCYDYLFFGGNFDFVYKICICFVEYVNFVNFFFCFIVEYCEIFRIVEVEDCVIFWCFYSVVFFISGNFVNINFMCNFFIFSCLYFDVFVCYGNDISFVIYKWNRRYWIVYFFFDEGCEFLEYLVCWWFNEKNVSRIY